MVFHIRYMILAFLCVVAGYYIIDYVHSLDAFEGEAYVMGRHIHGVKDPNAFWIFSVIPIGALFFWIVKKKLRMVNYDEKKFFEVPKCPLCEKSMKYIGLNHFIGTTAMYYCAACDSTVYAKRTKYFVL